MVSISAFEVLGPIMVGPSSSHTAGALRLALVARSIAGGAVEHADFLLYNSFSRTHEGHGTDRALVAGMLGLAPDDERVRDSFSLAEAEGLGFSIEEKGDDASLHPNSVEIRMRRADGMEVSVLGESVGGGRVRISAINGVAVEIAGELPTVFVAHRDVAGTLGALTGILGGAGVNIATMRSFRDERGGSAYTVFEVDDAVDEDLLAQLRAVAEVGSVSMVLVPGAPPAGGSDGGAFSFSCGEDLLAGCKRAGAGIGSLMRSREMALHGAEGSPELVDEGMARVLDAMRTEVADTIERPLRSLGGFLDGQARAVATAEAPLAEKLMGPVLTKASAYAMATLERSAAMGVIVAAPTAGSAGVVPGALLASAEAAGLGDDALADALWCAAAVGAVISENASVAGAEGGCQAEVGTAAAMAAAGIAALYGASPELCLGAASIAISNLLGLVCDPVQGLVEHPCQLRNALGVSVAVSSAQLALSGVASPIPFDEVVAAMAEVGSALPASLRETALGGLAATPSACASCGGCGGCIS